MIEGAAAYDKARHSLLGWDAPRAPARRDMGVHRFEGPYGAKGCISASEMRAENSRSSLGTEASVKHFQRARRKKWLMERTTPSEPFTGTRKRV